ncbi:hypothetical protein J437_LFUL015483 [Ladona fulva]|uniref:ERAP1-like C-terminal domain-containing protein n=1 Tax=Ladona fulva TaxID=123851 RepID=A0A8K0P6R8_LADFU|nr:hypothetical protein J437_LFUL015483 [Ladona fulva]
MPHLRKYSLWWNRVAPDLREVVFCNGIRYGSTSEWEFAWQRCLNSNASTERDFLLDSLGCTREIPLLEKQWKLRNFRWYPSVTLIRSFHYITFEVASNN